MSKEKQFWDWFEINEAKYFFLSQIDDAKERERILDDFLYHLHSYSNQLFFEIGGYPDEKQDLIITAEGDVDHFGEVEAIVQAAPELEHWNVIAFKPSKGADFITTYNSAILDPKEMWFDPLNNKHDTLKIGLRLYSENYDENNQINFLSAAYIVLDNILGEKSNALNIDYVELKAPSLSQKENAIELYKLPKYIEWFKSKSKI